MGNSLWSPNTVIGKQSADGTDVGPMPRVYSLRTAANIGTTTSDVLQMFIYAFNDHHGFHYPVQSRRMQVEAFETEENATRFATDLAMEAFLHVNDRRADRRQCIYADHLIQLSRIRLCVWWSMGEVTSILRP